MPYTQAIVSYGPVSQRKWMLQCSAVELVCRLICKSAHIKAKVGLSQLGHNWCGTRSYCHLK